MFLLLHNRTNDIVIAHSLFEVKEHFLSHLFDVKEDVVLDSDLNDIYVDIVNRVFLAEDELEVRKCIVTANAYFKQRISML